MNAACALALAIALWIAAVPRDAAACAPAARTWASACGASSAVSVTPELCLPGRFVLSVTAPGGTPLRIEITRGQRSAFRRAGALGLSPVGEFSDWGLAPEPTRRAFDAVAACAERGVPDAVFAPGAAPAEAMTPTGPRSRAPWPWKLIAAAVLGLLAVGVRARRRRRRAVLLDALPLGALTVFGFFVRRFAHPAAFFQQNGQGPLWVENALGEPSVYGRGYREVFGRVAEASPLTPDLAIFSAQSALCALVPAAAWSIARRAGAPRALAWGVSLAVAIEPILARLARSESYYATSGALLFLAAAALASGARGLRVASVAFAASALSAGLLVAQAAVVHPVCWVAAALVPIAVLVGPGALRRRALAALAGSAIVALVVLAAALPSMRDTMRTSFGAQWGGEAQRGVGLPVWRAALAWGAVFAAAVVASRRRARGAVRAGAFVGVVLVARQANVLGAATPWVLAAYGSLFVPPALAALAALAGGALRTRRQDAIAAGVIAALTLALGAARWRAMTSMPTGAREQTLALSWRATLPLRAAVYYAGRAGRHVTVLPLYSCCDPRSPRGRPLDAREAPPASLGAPGDAVYYYRSSLCSTHEGRAYCDAVERNVGLERVFAAELPAVAGLAGLGYDTTRVRLGLFRVAPR